MKKILTIFHANPTLKRSLLAAAILLVAGGGIFSAMAYAAPLTIEQLPDRQRVDQPVELTMSKRVDELDLSKIVISPKISGIWKHVAGSISQDDRIVFAPTKPLQVNTNYIITMPIISLKYGADVQPGAVSFMTEAAPGLSSSVGLMALAEGAKIPADQALEVALTSKNRELRNLELRLEPSINTAVKTVDDTKYVWSLEGFLPQGKPVSIEIYDTKNNVSLLKRSYEVAAEPQIKTPVKPSYFTNKDQAIIAFDQPIDEASAKFIEFSLEGTGVWRDNKTYQFTPSGVEPGKEYSYIIKKGLRSTEGGIVAEDRPYTFSTTGAITAKASPYGRELSQARQTVRFTFDQAVNRQSVEQRFSVSSGQVAGGSWNGNTYSVDVINMGFQRTITASVSAGVINQDFGLPSNQPFSAQFTTEVRTQRLNVPYYAQQQASTCTAAALRMALGYRGVGSNEMELVHKMGYQPREMDRSKDPHEWDDPAEMFVGRTDGGTIFTGAGPDAPPVAKAARASGRGATAVQGISASWIAQQLHEGNPVIMFGATRNAGIETWLTPSGRTARMNTASHVSVVTGVKGEPDNPLGFWVNDPLYGASYWSTAQVQANIARDVYRQAVVVH